MIGDVRQPGLQDALIAFDRGEIGQLFQPSLHSCPPFDVSFLLSTVVVRKPVAVMTVALFGGNRRSAFLRTTSRKRRLHAHRPAV
uniref:Uncharacterized protein n=1 Tax=Agrobacterium vitis TaxID=373 RepID=A0A2Z2Q6J8_AGRVI|nr:hypothetical protein [Agrobacterium vitis]